jgi:RND family efflux transporter MFP subunit
MLITVAAIAIAALARPRPPERPAAAEVTPAARRDDQAVVKATGVIKPMIGAEVRVGSRISGAVERLFVRVGDTVREGQPLAELDARDLLARRAEARAALDLAAAELDYARADLRRKRDLNAAAVVAEAELDLARRTMAVAEQRVAGAEASLAFAATQLAYARIVAPISGVVASVATQEGETVAASFTAPTFVTLVDLARLEVWAYVDETDIGRIRVGQRALFTVDTYGEEAFAGLVTAIYPKAEIRDNVVNYITVIRFDPPRDRTLRPEMTTTVRIAVDTLEDA